MNTTENIEKILELFKSNKLIEAKKEIEKKIKIYPNSFVLYNILGAVLAAQNKLDDAIQNYIRREYGLAIGERTAEEIKWTVGSAAETPGEGRAEVRGREMFTGMPKTVILQPYEIRTAIEEPVSVMVDSVVSCLGKAPPELAQDLLTSGIYLVGGGSLLRGLDSRISQETGVPVVHAESPMECVVLGAGQLVEDFDAMRAMFMEARR